MQEEIVSPDVQISLTIEVRLNTPPGLPAKIFERGLRGGNANQFVYEVRERILLIEKSGMSVGDQLGYPSNRWRQNNSLHRHRFHQGLRNSFAVAGEHHRISLTVENS